MYNVKCKMYKIEEKTAKTKDRITGFGTLLSNNDNDHLIQSSKEKKLKEQVLSYHGNIEENF